MPQECRQFSRLPQSFSLSQRNHLQCCRYYTVQKHNQQTKSVGNTIIPVKMNSSSCLVTKNIPKVSAEDSLSTLQKSPSICSNASRLAARRHVFPNFFILQDASNSVLQKRFFVFSMLNLCSRLPRQVCSQSGRCHVIRTGTRAVPHQVAVAPLIILSPIVTRCNSPSHDWWCRCLITPRQNPPKITFRPRGQLHELHELHWRGRWGAGGVVWCHMHVRFVLFQSRNQRKWTVIFLYVSKWKSNYLGEV